MKQLLIIITIFLLSCGFKTRKTLNIGDKIDELIKIDSSYIAMKNSGSFDTVYVVNINGVKYEVFLNKEKRIDYLATSDPLFKSQEGISIRMSFKNLRQLSSDYSIKQERGWAIYVELPSGWNAAFGLPNEKSNSIEISDTATVKWLFKR